VSRDCSNVRVHHGCVFLLLFFPLLTFLLRSHMIFFRMPSYCSVMWEHITGVTFFPFSPFFYPSGNLADFLSFFLSFLFSVLLSFLRCACALQVYVCIYTYLQIYNKTRWGEKNRKLTLGLLPVDKTRWEETLKGSRSCFFLRALSVVLFFCFSCATSLPLPLSYSVIFSRFVFIFDFVYFPWHHKSEESVSHAQKCFACTRVKKVCHMHKSVSHAQDWRKCVTPTSGCTPTL